jgi:hypothetical protein
MGMWREDVAPPSWPGLSRPSTTLPQPDPRVSFGAMGGGWVYIMTNRPNGTLYTGVTNDIASGVRIWPSCCSP